MERPANLGREGGENRAGSLRWALEDASQTGRWKAIGERLVCSVGSSQEELESFLSEKCLTPKESWDRLGMLWILMSRFHALSPHQRTVCADHSPVCADHSPTAQARSRYISETNGWVDHGPACSVPFQAFWQVAWAFYPGSSLGCYPMLSLYLRITFCLFLSSLLSLVQAPSHSPSLVPD